MSDEIDISQESTIMGRIARRLRMTEGQLYSAVLIVLVVTLLTLTGLPTAERTPETDSGGDIPTLEPTFAEEGP